MDKTTITHYMWKFINAWPEKPVPQIALGALPKEGLGIMMQQLAGTVVQKRYVDGAFIGVWPFAVYVRVAADETARRIDAMQTLDDLSDWVRQGLPDIGPNRQPLRLEMTSLPALAAAYGDGTEDYQAIFGLQYKETRG